MGTRCVASATIQRNIKLLLGQPRFAASAALRDGREIARDVRLVSLWQGGAGGGRSREELRGQVETVTVEQAGPVRAVVRLTGRHAPVRPGPAPQWLPFTVRLYFYAGAEDVRVVHSLIWDGAADRDFLAGLGRRAGVPMRDEPHDRHVRLAAPTAEDGRPSFLTEAVRGITGLRRDPGERFRQAQLAGRACGPVSEWDPAVAGRLALVPCWRDWTLDQLSPDGFTLRKRTGLAAIQNLALIGDRLESSSPSSSSGDHEVKDMISGS